MSLKIIMADDTSFDNFIKKIKDETGVKITTTDNGYWDNITFPDGVTSRPANSTERENTSGNYAFVDVNTHLFIYGSGIDDTNVSSNTVTKQKIFITDTTDGRIVSISNAYEYYALFNIPREAAHDASKQSITIFPCYYGKTAYSSIQAFLKNIYINYERRFVAGLKFIDQNGNKFVTLGSYLLYKVD